MALVMTALAFTSCSTVTASARTTTTVHSTTTTRSGTLPLLPTKGFVAQGPGWKVLRQATGTGERSLESFTNTAPHLFFEEVCVGPGTLTMAGTLGIMLPCTGLVETADIDHLTNVVKVTIVVRPTTRWAVYFAEAG